MKFSPTCLLFLLALCGCRERIDITTDNAAPQLVITGYITTDTMSHVITIAQTTGYFGADISKTYDDALVTINGTPLHALGNGRYATGADFFGEPEKTYLLEAYIDKDNNGELQYYSASATMPSLHILDSITLRFFRSGSDGQPFWSIIVHFQDVMNVPNLFGAHLYINSLKYSNKLRRYFINQFDEGAAEGQYIRFPLFDYIIRHEMRWDGDERIKVYTGDTLTVELNMIERTYFRYLQAAKSEVMGSNPLFAGPPANVPGNIQGGALGIFGAYTTSRQSLVLTEEHDFPKRK